MDQPDNLLPGALREKSQHYPMMVVGIRIGQQIQEIFKDLKANGSMTVYGPGENDAALLIEGLEMTTSRSRARGEITYKSNRHYRVVSECCGQQAEFEILPSLLSMIDEGSGSDAEEDIARQIWELASDEIYLLTLEE
jgi:hypothetical protein